jgi:hypothetical protein
MEDDMMGNVEFRYDSNSKLNKKECCPPSLTLSFPSGKEQIPENMLGSFRIVDLKGSFAGLKGFFHAGGPNDTPRVNCWEIADVNWGENSDEESEGHFLEIYDLANDNGNKFIAFIWDQGWWGYSPHSST